MIENVHRTVTFIATPILYTIVGLIRGSVQRKLLHQRTFSTSDQIDSEQVKITKSSSDHDLRDLIVQGGNVMVLDLNVRVTGNFMSFRDLQVCKMSLWFKNFRQRGRDKLRHGRFVGHRTDKIWIL